MIRLACESKAESSLASEASECKINLSNFHMLDLIIFLFQTSLIVKAIVAMIVSVLMV